MSKKTCVIVGSQWGDEGKGKIVDYLASEFQAVVRYQGGNNAGHTVIVNGEKSVLHLLPSGIFSSNTCNVIAHGVVVEPAALVKEIEMIQSKGHSITSNNLCISSSATVITTYAKMLDLARENNADTQKIGTTGKGIGPSYEDKVARRAIRMGDLLDMTILKKKLEGLWKERAFVLLQLYGVKNIPRVEEEATKLFELGKKLAPFIREEIAILDKIAEQGGKVLYEGAQGVMLDVNFGTYPFVTSSNTTIGGVYTGSYVPGFTIDRVIGITKAYTTRVGEGAFPSELKNELGDSIQQKGNEVGATTGRKRRCGWLDLAQLKYAVKVSGITEIALTKIDILMNLGSLNVVMAYKYREQVYDRYHLGMNVEEIEPIVQSLAPLVGEIKASMSRSDLPKSVDAYLTLIEKELKIPVSFLAYGPDRTQTLKF